MKTREMEELLEILHISIMKTLEKSLRYLCVSRFHRLLKRNKKELFPKRTFADDVKWIVCNNLERSVLKNKGNKPLDIRSV